MRYAMVHTRFWIDPDISALGRDARELYLYLITCPNSNMAGYFYLPMSYMLEHLQTDGYRYGIDTLSKDLQRLTEAKKVEYDPVAKVVLVRNHIAWNRPEGPKQVTGVIFAVREVPASRLLSEFVTCACENAPLHADKWKELLDGYQYPIDTVSIAGTGTGTDTGTGTGSINTPLNPPEGKKRKQRQTTKKPEYTEDFLRFWTVYPRKENKVDAFACWQTRLAEGVSTEDLITATGHYAAARQGYEERHILQPTTFLGPNARWEEHLTSKESPKAPQIHSRRQPDDDDEATRALRELERGDIGADIQRIG